MEKQRHHQPQLRLLPHYFKKIGRGIILLVIIILIICSYFKVEFKNYNPIIATVLLDLITIGGLLYTFAKDKIEDELLNLIRLQSVAYAFIFSVLYVVILPLIAYLISGHDIDVK